MRSIEQLRKVFGKFKIFKEFEHMKKVWSGTTWSDFIRRSKRK